MINVELIKAEIAREMNSPSSEWTFAELHARLIMVEEAELMEIEPVSTDLTSLF